MRGVLLFAVGALAAGGVLFLNRSQSIDDSSGDLVSGDIFENSESGEAVVDEQPLTLTDQLNDYFGAAASFLIPASFVMDNQNLNAFLRLIRVGEGTADDGGYSRLFGGASFSGFADHPRQVVTRSGIKSTAAGAYQILSRTWDDLRKSGVDLPDFSPENQDKAAIALIKRRGALADVLAGRFDAAIRKTNKEWASLPGSPYGQPTLSLDRAYRILAQNGGVFDSGVIV